MDGRYDYIIVGAGSAGCVLANRLSADPSIRVLLLEAGPRDWHPMLHIPLGWGYNLSRPTFNWLYRTEPEPGAAGRSLAFPRGKVLGGTSTINGMLHVRGQAADYDEWGDLGNDGWRWADVLPYFRKLEHYPEGEGPTRGRGGPLAVSNIERHDLSDVMLSALQGAGLDHCDTNTGAQSGYGYVESVTRNGLRQSTAVAYLKPARRRPNLNIATNALATRVTFEGRRAVGVEYMRSGQKAVAIADKEIIISGGSVNSPQLLELSGIGKAEILRAAGIDVLSESPEVGENLQDHYGVLCCYRVTKGSTINESTRGMKLFEEVLKYITSRRGLLTLTPVHIFGFIATELTKSSRPDVTLAIVPATLDLQTQLPEHKPGMTCAPSQLRPESRGSIHISSSDPREAPKIIGNYLTAQIDQDTIVAGLRFSRMLCSRPEVSEYLGEELAPGCSLQSDDELLAYARETGMNLYHPTSTCRMGADVRAVVDSRLRVKGVSGLRVVDASVMPKIVSGNTNTPTIMIAEKASDMILADA